MTALANKTELDAGSDQEPWVPDFRVAPLENAGWQIAILSPRASRWLQSGTRAAMFGSAETLTSGDIASVNVLVSTARKSGLRVEYVGPNQVVRF